MPPAHISRVRAPKRPRHKGERDLHDDLRRGDFDPKKKNNRNAFPPGKNDLKG